MNWQRRAAAGSLLLLLVACSDGGGATGPVNGDTSQGSRPAGDSDASSDVATAGPLGVLTVGTCLDAEGADVGVIDAATIDVLPCDAGHGLEVYAVLPHPGGGDASYPGAAQLQGFAEDRCLDAFEGYVGAPYATSTLDFAVALPDERGWDRGERVVACAAYDADFEELTGSIAGAAR